MHFSLVSLTALAASVVATNISTHSHQICKTALNTQQGSGGTSTKSSTQHITRTIKTTITSTKTVIPSSTTIGKKSTITKTSTITLPQSTDTFSFTTTFITTSTLSTTLISTSTSTATALATSTFNTTTIAASTGFVPLSSAVAASGHTVSKRRKRGVKDHIRAAEAESKPATIEERATAQKIICGSDGSITYDPPQYFGSVTCYKRVQIVTTDVVTSTAKTTKTVTAPRGTVTTTSFITTTKNITETPIAASTTITLSTTLTINTTATFSSTTTLLTTTTSAVYAAQPTFYAACASNNIVSFVDGNRISNIVVADPNNGFSFGNSTSDAYSCCVQCIQSGSCGGSTYHPASETCYFFPFGVQGTCDATSEAGTFKTQTGTNVGFVVSNSNCGEVELVAA